jgi:hypothetical protein
MADQYDDFSNHPRTIGEIRSDRSDRAADWSPREALIAMLRDIDSGKVDPDAMVIAFRDKAEPGKSPDSGFYTASPDGLTTLGLLTRTIDKIQRFSDR